MFGSVTFDHYLHFLSMVHGSTHDIYFMIQILD